MHQQTYIASELTTGNQRGVDDASTRQVERRQLERWVTCMHEAAHFVSDWILGLDVQLAAVRSEHDNRAIWNYGHQNPGRVAGACWSALVAIETPHDARVECMRAWAGQIGELMVPNFASSWKPNAGAGSDVARLESVADLHGGSDWGQWLADNRERCRRMLGAHVAHVMRVANQLAKAGAVTPEGIELPPRCPEWADMPVAPDPAGMPARPAARLAALSTCSLTGERADPAPRAATIGGIGTAVAAAVEAALEAVGWSPDLEEP